MSTTKNNPVDRLIQPYLSFNGCCEQALEFYRKTLGAEIQMLMRFQDSPEPPPPGCGPVDGNKVMHASVRIGDTIIMASDGQCTGATKFEGISLSLSVGTEAEAVKYFNGLAEGGTVCMPLTKTFFSPKFGMVTDRFGVTWMVMTVPAGEKK